MLYLVSSPLYDCQPRYSHASTQLLECSLLRVCLIPCSRGYLGSFDQLERPRGQIRPCELCYLGRLDGCNRTILVVRDWEYNAGLRESSGQSLWTAENDHRCQRSTVGGGTDRRNDNQQHDQHANDSDETQDH
jgi:hypothetical protein